MRISDLLGEGPPGEDPPGDRRYDTDAPEPERAARSQFAEWTAAGRAARPPAVTGGTETGGTHETPPDVPAATLPEPAQERAVIPAGGGAGSGASGLTRQLVAPLDDLLPTRNRGRGRRRR